MDRWLELNIEFKWQALLEICILGLLVHRWVLKVLELNESLGNEYQQRSDEGSRVNPIAVWYIEVGEMAIKQECPGEDGIPEAK